MQENGVDPVAVFGADEEHPILMKLRALWGDNGNSLSVQYSGTESTTSGITKDGKEGIFSAISSGLKSVNRFFINNFGDDYKQQCIDILLSRESITSNTIRRNIDITEEDGKEEDGTNGHMEICPITMFIGSWNVGGEVPGTDIDLSKWLGASESELP